MTDIAPRARAHSHPELSERLTGVEHSLARVHERIDTLEGVTMSRDAQIETRMAAMQATLGTPPNPATGGEGAGMAGRLSALYELIDGERRARERTRAALKAVAGVLATGGVLAGIVRAAIEIWR